MTVLDIHKNKIFSAEKRIDNQTNFCLKINPNFLTRGKYSIQAIIYKPAITQYDFLEDVCEFNVNDAGSNFAHLETFDYGRVFGNCEWL